MNFLKSIKWPHIHPFWIAMTIALFVTILYVLSGRGNLDLNTREIEKSGKVQNISASGQNSIIVTCKNGQKYEIVYAEGQTNFEDLIYDKCQQ